MCEKSYKSNDKSVESFHLDDIEKKHQPGPPGRELSVKTKDGWFYNFREARKGEGFQFHRKRHPDGSTCETNTVPRPILRHFEQKDGIRFCNINKVGGDPNTARA